MVDLKITDDYGISDAYMVATVAKGLGEAVKFREEKMAFSTRFRHIRKRQGLQKNWI
jgi:hypothetical protein